MNDKSAATSPAAAAGLGRRFGSLFYEVLLLTAVVYVGSWAFLIVGRGLDPSLARPLLQLYLLAIAAGYFIYCWTHGGQTLPMKTWQLRVTARNGGDVTLQVGARRYLFALASIALCGAGFVWAALDRDGQFLHDRLAGTCIVSC